MLDFYMSSQCFFIFVSVELSHLLSSYFETRVVSIFKENLESNGRIIASYMI